MALTRPKYSQIYDTDYKQSVRVATTEDVGNLLATGNMTNSIDGVTLNLLDRILVKDQTDAKQNGIYRVLTVGTGSDGTWGRALDANANDKITAGMTTIVSEGNTNISKTFRLATPDPIVIGTTELTFVDPFVITASAGGANTYVQFNDINQLGGSPAFTFNKVGNVLSVGGNINVTGSILPTANVTYDLGSPTQRWRDGWFSGSTIYLGTESLSVDANGKWMFSSDGETVEFGSSAVFNPPNANISGNVTATNYLFANGVPLMTAVDGMVSSANINLKGYIDGEILTATSAISTANVNLKGYVDGQFTSLINGSPATLDTLNEIAAALGNDANLSVTLTNKITGVQGNITAANAAIVTANTNMKGYVDNGLSSLSSNRINAGTSDVTVTENFVNVAIDSTNVASFSSTGILTTGNITTSSGKFIGDGSLLTGIQAGALYTASATPPASPTANDVWYDTSTDIIFKYINDGDSSQWVDISSNPLNVNTSAIVGTTLSITGNGTVSGTLTVDVITLNSGDGSTAIINGGTDGVGNIGSNGSAFNTIFAKATSAQYADLAEIYTSDQTYQPGTVVIFGGDSEITISKHSHDTRIAGVISTNPAYIMNDTVDGLAVALQGRVPCLVLGPITKGQLVVASDIEGTAQAINYDKYLPGCVIGKSLEDIVEDKIKLIEVVIGRI